MNIRITPEWVKSLKPYEIFVFGSNLSGFHGGGAAKTAMQWGAVWGQAEGLMGNTYGLPTVYYNISRTLTVDEIRPYAERFIEFAGARPDLLFLLTPVGCGIAGLNAEDIAPLFKDAVELENVYMPETFWEILNK